MQQMDKHCNYSKIRKHFTVELVEFEGNWLFPKHLRKTMIIIIL